MNHYVYYSYEDWGRGYIGVRQCKCNIEEDLYFGSYFDKTFNPSNKIVLLECETREEALAAEIVLHRFYNVKDNPHFANQANQTSTKFDCIKKRRPMSEETKNKLRESQKGKPRGKQSPEHVAKRLESRKKGGGWDKETNKKISNSLKGNVLSNETKQKISESLKGKMKGFKHSEETKRKISEARRQRNKKIHNGLT